MKTCTAWSAPGPPLTPFAPVYRHMKRSPEVLCTCPDTNRCDSEWALLQEVFNHLCSRWHTPHVDLFCNQIQSQISQVCVSYPLSASLAGGHVQSPLAGDGRLRFSESSNPGPSSWTRSSEG